MKIDDSVLEHEWVVIPEWRRKKTNEKAILEGEFFNKFYDKINPKEEKEEGDDEIIEEQYIPDNLIKDEL